MAFNANLPADHAPLSSAEMRGQLNGLNDLIAAVPESPAMTAVLNNTTAGSLAGVELLAFEVSNPPTQMDVVRLAGKLNEIIALLQRA